MPRVPKWLSEWIEVLSVAQFVWTVGIPMIGTTVIGFFAGASPSEWAIMFMVGILIVLVLLDLQVRKKSKAFSFGSSSFDKVDTDRPDESKLTPASGLSGPYINGHHFRITDLVKDHHIIQDRTFENCTIWGPAIIVLEKSVVLGATIGNPDEVLYEIGERYCVGVIGVVNCTFKKCKFFKIGFMGSKANMDGIRKAIQRPS